MSHLINLEIVSRYMNGSMLDRGMIHHTDSIENYTRIYIYIVQWRLNSVNWVELCMQPSNLGDLHCHKPWHYSANDVSASHHGSRKRCHCNPKASFKKKGTPRNKEWWKLAQMIQLFSPAFINWNACFTSPCLCAKLHGVTWSEHACIDQSNDCKGKLPSISLIPYGSCNLDALTPLRYIDDLYKFNPIFDHILFYWTKIHEPPKRAKAALWKLWLCTIPQGISIPFNGFPDLWPRHLWMHLAGNPRKGLIWFRNPKKIFFSIVFSHWVMLMPQKTC